MNARQNSHRGSDLRSLGLKLMVVCGLALAMTIPALFVSELVTDRMQRASEVTKEISAHVGGAQIFMGPVFAVPYRASTGAPAGSLSDGICLIFPEQARAEVKVATTERKRSLFRVPVFAAELKLESDFDSSALAPPAGTEFDWTRAEIIVGASDLHGALADPTLELDGHIYGLAPSELSDRLLSQNREKAPFKGGLLAARPDVKMASVFHVVSSMKFSGAERIGVVAYGKTTHVLAQGDWRNPGFDGGVLPVTRSVNDKGFRAEWMIPFTARGLRASGAGDVLSGLQATAVGFYFVQLGDPYQSVYRSLKYVLLIVGLVFLCYFGFEVTTARRVHPAQYVLVGLAQIIFYLLLLSMSERIGFDLGFLLAAGATVSLLSVNAGWIFEGSRRVLWSFGIFGILYSLIYLLLRMEDNSLLIGALSSFFAIALLMYLTRRVDWYGSPQPAGAADQS